MFRLSDLWTRFRARSAAPHAPRSGGRVRQWASRFGALGFMFFLIKGLLWLTIPWLVARGLMD